MSHKKVIPRSERKHSRARIFSLVFMDNMISHGTDGNKCFIPLEDYNNLWKKYKTLVARHRREINRKCDGK